jgi:hypothetical protein
MGYESANPPIDERVVRRLSSEKMSKGISWLAAVGLATLSIAVADWLIAGVLADTIKFAPNRLFERFDVFVSPEAIGPAILGVRLVAAAAVGFWFAAAIDRARSLRVGIAAGLLAIVVDTGVSLMLEQVPDVLPPLLRLACLLGGLAVGLRWPLRENARRAVTWAGMAMFVAGLIANAILMPALWRPMRLAAFQRVSLPVCFDGRLVVDARALLAKGVAYAVAASVTPQAVADCYRRTIATGWQPITPESVERGIGLDGLFALAWRDPESGWRLTLFVSLETLPESSPFAGHRVVQVTLEAPGYRWTPSGAASPALLSTP